MEWRNDGMMEWRNDGMTEWWSDGVMEWWSDDDDDDDDYKESMGWPYDSFDCLLLLIVKPVTSHSDAMAKLTL